MTKTLALIPARGGSKGIPRKNIRTVAGKPLISWTIGAALDARGIDRVVVSTDDEEIREVSLAAGAEVPILRPASLANDDASSLDVVRHAISETPCDTLVLLQPTSPLRTVAHIEEALALHWQTGRPVVAVTAAKPWLFELDDAGALSALTEIAEARQKGQRLYTPNGALYIAAASSLIAGRSWWDGGPLPYIMASNESIDIDEPHEMVLAELLLRGETEKS